VKTTPTLYTKNIYTKNILVITSSRDATVDYLENKYGDFVSFIRINTDKLDEYLIRIKTSKVSFYINGKHIILDDIYSIYYRKPILPDRIAEYDNYYFNFLYKEFREFLFGFINTFRGKIITDPYVLMRASNKILQLSVAKKIGFLIPETLITNDVDFLKEKLLKSVKKWIIKPLSNGKLTHNKIVSTNLITKDFINKDNLESIRIAPHIFQEYINKDFDLRLIVVKDKFFPVKIISENKIDWRKGKNVYIKTDIPSDIKEKCLKYMREFNLQFCAFDFVCKNENYYFLEGNPNGQWLWIEFETDYPISREIIKLLTS